jgi:hypothetical protein
LTRRRITARQSRQKRLTADLSAFLALAESKKLKRLALDLQNYLDLVLSHEMRHGKWVKDLAVELLSFAVLEADVLGTRNGGFSQFSDGNRFSEEAATRMIWELRQSVHSQRFGSYCDVVDIDADLVRERIERALG